MQELKVIDFTGGLFAACWFYIMPNLEWIKQGEDYIIMVDSTYLGVATITSITKLQMEKITPAMAAVATGKDLRSFRIYYQNHFRVKETDTVMVLVITWKQLETDALRALMTVRFDAVKGMRPHERNQQLSLSL
jgi:hypothetical protein